MFVKSSWRTYKGNRYQQFHLAESFRDPETGRPRHRLLLNLSCLPPYAIEAIRRSLRQGRADPPRVKVGDAICGAGFLAVGCAWRRTKMDAFLGGFSPRQRNLVRVLVGRLVLTSGARLEELWPDADAGPLPLPPDFSAAEVPALADKLGRSFHAVMARLRQRQGAEASVLGLYEVPGAWGGRPAGEYHRDPLQAVVGLVLDRAGIPVGVEVWSAADLERTNVLERIDGLWKRFAHPRIVLVGERDEPGAADIRRLAAVGLDYVLGSGRLDVGEGNPAGDRQVVYAWRGGPDARSYILETSLPAAEYPAARVGQLYRALPGVKGIWPGIVLHQEGRPVQGRRRNRVYGGVLLYFLAYYLVRTMELEMKKHGETRDGIAVLRDWERLSLVEVSCEIGGQKYRDRQWLLGPTGRAIREILVRMGWWSAIEEAARDLAAD